MFKVGDKVVCIDDTSSNNRLKKGNIYTVLEVGSEYIKLKTDWEYSEYFKFRFKLAKSEILKRILMEET